MTSNDETAIPFILAALTLTLLVGALLFADASVAMPWFKSRWFKTELPAPVSANYMENPELYQVQCKQIALILLASSTVTAASLAMYHIKQRNQKINKRGRSYSIEK